MRMETNKIREGDQGGPPQIHTTGILFEGKIAGGNGTHTGERDHSTKGTRRKGACLKTSKGRPRYPATTPERKNQEWNGGCRVTLRIATQGVKVATSLASQEFTVKGEFRCDVRGSNQGTKTSLKKVTELWDRVLRQERRPSTGRNPSARRKKRGLYGK